MVNKKFVIEMENGFHARPVSALVKSIKNFQCKINLNANSKDYDAKSILGVMSACLKKGDEVEFTCDGLDEEECMAVIASGFESNFGE